MLLKINQNDMAHIYLEVYFIIILLLFMRRVQEL